MATPPPAGAVATVKAYFVHRGAPLLTFARATTALTTDKKPSPATCDHLAKNVLPVFGTPSALANVALAIPDASLSRDFATDVRLKFFLLTACRQSQVIDPLIEQAFHNAQLLRARLARFGIAL